MTTRLVRLLIAWVFSLGGCFFQVYHICDVFFEYETVTQLTIRHPSEVAPPRVALCFEREASSKLSKNLSDEITFIFVSNREGYGDRRSDLPNKRLNVDDFVTTNYFYKRDHLCFSIALANGTRRFKTSFLTRTKTGPKYFQCNFRGKNLVAANVMLFYLKPINEDFYGAFDNFAEVDRGFKNNDTSGIGDNNYVTLTYSTFKGELIEYPYQTNCFNYLRWGYESRNHCYDKCVLDRFVAKFQELPFSVLSRNASLPLMNFLDIKKRNVLEIIERNCSTLCKRPDCSITHHVPQVMMTSPMHSNEIGFELYVSVEPDITTEFIPLLTFVDFATFVMSCVGFWLGFSPLIFLGSYQMKNKPRNVGLGNVHIPRHNVNRSLAQQVRIHDVKIELRDKEIRKLRQVCKELAYRMSHPSF